MRDRHCKTEESTIKTKVVVFELAFPEFSKQIDRKFLTRGSNQISWSLQEKQRNPGVLAKATALVLGLLCSLLSRAMTILGSSKNEEFLSPRMAAGVVDCPLN